MLTEKFVFMRGLVLFFLFQLPHSVPRSTRDYADKRDVVRASMNIMCRREANYRDKKVVYKTDSCQIMHLDVQIRVCIWKNRL